MDPRTRAVLDRPGTSVAALLVALVHVVGCGSTRSAGAARGGDPTGDASAWRDPGAIPQVDAGTTDPAGDLADAGARHGRESDAGQDRSTASLEAGATWVDACGHRRPDVFADAVISFAPGPSAGYGAKNMPCVVEGPPVGTGASGGSTDVVSLGNEGNIVLEFDDVELTDGPGPDLLVFENAFPGWAEPGFVAVSEDGRTWSEWPCEPQNSAGGYPHCAGIASVFSNPTNGIDPTDPAEAGGDAFDLADLGVTSARFVRIRDSGFSHYSGISGGFDLDAIAAVHSMPAPTKRD